MKKILYGKIPTEKWQVINSKNSIKRKTDRKILKYIREKRVNDFLKKYPTFKVMKFICNMKYKEYQFVILHKSTKTGIYQLSYFDDKGAIMDSQYDNYIEVVRDLIRLNNYTLVEVLN